MNILLIKRSHHMLRQVINAASGYSIYFNDVGYLKWALVLKTNRGACQPLNSSCLAFKEFEYKLMRWPFKITLKVELDGVREKTRTDTTNSISNLFSQSENVINALLGVIFDQSLGQLCPL